MDWVLRLVPRPGVPGVDSPSGSGKRMIMTMKIEGVCLHVAFLVSCLLPDVCPRRIGGIFLLSS